jgi:hypothetical protein
LSLLPNLICQSTSLLNPTHLGREYILDSKVIETFPAYYNYNYKPKVIAETYQVLEDLAIFTKMPPEDIPSRPMLRRTSTSLDAELEKIHRAPSPTHLQFDTNESPDDNQANVSRPMTNFEAQISGQLRKVGFNEDQEAANKTRIDSGVSLGPDGKLVSHAEDDRLVTLTRHGSRASEGDFDLLAGANTDGTGDEQLLQSK